MARITSATLYRFLKRRRIVQSNDTAKISMASKNKKPRLYGEAAGYRMLPKCYVLGIYGHSPPGNRSGQMFDLKTLILTSSFPGKTYRLAHAKSVAFSTAS